MVLRDLKPALLLRGQVAVEGEGEVEVVFEKVEVMRGRGGGQQRNEAAFETASNIAVSANGNLPCFCSLGRLGPLSRLNFFAMKADLSGLMWIES